MNASLQFICLLLLLNRGEFICCDGIIIQNIIDSNGNRNNDGDSDVDHGGGELIFAQTVSYLPFRLFSVVRTII